MVAKSGELQVGELHRDVRENRGVSVRTLAAKSGFSPSFISQVENGQASPSIASLEKIAGALDVTLVAFFRAGEARSSAVLHVEQRPRLESGWSNAKIEVLSLVHDTRLEPLLITLRAGGMSGKRPHTSPHEQFAFVVSGQITLVLDEAEQVLMTGDAVTIAPQQPFRWVNPSPEPAQLLAISSRCL